MTREEFAKGMLNYADIQPAFAPNFKKTNVLNHWFECLGGIDKQTLGTAMKTLCCENRFPSIKEIQKACGQITEMTDDDVARDCVARIRGAVDKLGYVASDDKVEEKIGSLGMHLIRTSGGWSNFCQSFESWKDLDIRLAQMREHAKAVLKQAREGTLNIAPQLPSASKSTEISALIQKAADNCDLTPQTLNESRG